VDDPAAGEVGGGLGDGGEAPNVPPVGSEGEGEEEPDVARERPDPVAAAECDTRFRLDLSRPGASVFVAGEWAGWDPDLSALTDGNGEGLYETAISVPVGAWGYKFVVDGEWLVDPSNPEVRYVDGQPNSRLDVDNCESRSARPVRAEVDGDTVTLLDDRGRRHIFEGLEAGRHDLVVGDFVAPVWIEDEPFDVRDGAIYFVFVDRFRNGDPGNDAPVGAPTPIQADWHGGDLAGVSQALQDGWFEALGVRTLWLSPLNESADGHFAGKDGRQYSGYHGYWPVASRRIEPRFGTLDELNSLTAEAHSRGIRVIVDLVWNQVHQDHDYRASHPEWFRGDGGCVCGAPGCGWDDRPLDCWFTDYLPDVDWTHMGAVDAFRDDALWWLTAAGIDGFRVDAVKHMEDIAVTTLRASIERELGGGGTTFHLVGETFTGSDGRALVARYVGDDRLHGQFDFPLFWTAMGAFAHESASMVDLEAAVAASAAAYPGRWMSPFLGNHDVERFMSRAAGDLRGDPGEQGFADPPGRPQADPPFERAKLAFAWLLTQPGAPLIYYGDEIGMPGAGDPDNRRMMRFDEGLNDRETALLDHVRAWGRLRAASPAIRRGAMRTLHVDEQVYVYLRGTGPGAIVIGLNRGSERRTVNVDLPQGRLEVVMPARGAVHFPVPNPDR
jgi:glycosidase